MAACRCAACNKEILATDSVLCGECVAERYDPVGEDSIRLESELIKVEFSELGEGYQGDYDPDDPEDRELLRLDVLVRAGHGVSGEETGDPEWIYPQDGSACTLVGADSPPIVRRQYLTYALEQLDDAVRAGKSLKRTVEQLSWMGSDPNFADGKPRCRFCGARCNEACSVSVFSGTDYPYVCPTCWAGPEEGEVETW